MLTRVLEFLPTGHIFMPIAFTMDTEIFGFQIPEAIFSIYHRQEENCR